MQVPEKLALIGGSILLASTLVFTLKSQASQILPKAIHPISIIYHDVSDAQKNAEFDDGYNVARRKDWDKGQWGTAKYYVDNQHNMYVGSGDLQRDHLRSVIGEAEADDLRSLNFMGTVKVPPKAHFLLSVSDDGYDANCPLSTITGLEYLDTSHTVDMSNIFSDDNELRNIDLSKLNVDHVKDMYCAFWGTKSLSNSELHKVDMTGKNTEYAYDGR